MKIVHFVPSLVKGGGERAVVDLSNWQAAQGHELTIVAGLRVDERLLRNDISDRVNVIYITENAGRASLYLSGTVWLWRNRLWLSACDILHAHMSFPAFLMTLFFYYRSLVGGHARVFETYHAVGVAIPKFDRACHAVMARRRDRLILMAQDPYWCSYALKRPAQAISVVANGLGSPRCRTRDDPEVQTYARAANIRHNGLIVGTVGRFVPERRPELYIPVFAHLARALGTSVNFVMAGAGPQLNQVADLAHAQGISEQISFPGLALDPSVPITLCDLYLTVSVGPVAGLAAVHAAFCGIPVLAIQLIPDYAPSRDDWIWSASDLNALARKALSLLRSPAELQDLAQKQQEFARENLSIEKMGMAYQSLYESELGGIPFVANAR